MHKYIHIRILVVNSYVALVLHHYIIFLELKFYSNIGISIFTNFQDSQRCSNRFILKAGDKIMKVYTLYSKYNKTRGANI